MNDSKNRDLAISARSKIHEKVTDALRKRDTDKRWFWELLQNGKDTVVFKKNDLGEFNSPNKKLHVVLTLDSNSQDGTYLIFQHDGNPFKPSNHPYKYDDPKCLLLADSGKIEENETDREDITGQFGTGFLSTHIISMRILVEGIFLDRNSKFNSFKFELDRKYSNPLQLGEKVEKSLDQYDSNFKPIPETNEILTKFTYYLNDSKDGLESGIAIVNTGVLQLEKYLPYVLAFSKEIDSVEFVDNIINNKTIKFSRASELVRSQEPQTITIYKHISKNPKPEEIHIRLISNINEHIDLAIPLTTLNGLMSVNFNSEVRASLFCTFPLIGSEQWRFPTIFNCSKFFPETERNGITLITGKDYGNQQRVEHAVSLYMELVKDCVKHNYQNLWQLADTTYSISPIWCDESWYASILNKIRLFLLDQPIVLNANKKPILLSMVLVPQGNDEESQLGFWDISIALLADRLPHREHLSEWVRIIDVPFEKWADLKFFVTDLLIKIKEIGDIESLSQDKFSNNAKEAKAWLRLVFKYLIKAGYKPLLDEYEVVPNQTGTFSKLCDLRYDLNIPEELKDILELFGQDKRDILIDRVFEEFRDHKALNVEDVSNIINKHITDKSRIDNDEFKKGMYQMCSYFTSENSEKRNQIHSFAKKFLTGQIADRIILSNTRDFNWDNVNKWIVKSMSSGIEKLETTTNVQNHLGGSLPETQSWLNSFAIFLSKNNYTELLDENKVLPNQYGEMSCAKELSDDVDAIPDKLKEILYDLSNKSHDWKATLLDGSFTFNLNRPKYLKDICTLIDDLAKDQRDNLSNPLVRKSILSLVTWVTDKNNKLPMEDLFKWFFVNKANLVLSTLDSTHDRDNIFDIIQSGHSLETLAKVAKSKLTEDQLNQIVEHPDLLAQFIKAKDDLGEEQLSIILSNKSLVTDFVSWLAAKEKDHPDEELGAMGEEFTYFYLCKVFGKDNVCWENKSEYDFKVLNPDKSIKYFIDSKTTSRGISNSDNVPFYLRTSQWRFLPRPEVKDKYLVARIFKNGQEFEVHFLNLKSVKI